MRFYERGPVRIRFEEAGSGFPLLIIAGGGLNSTMANLARSFGERLPGRLQWGQLAPGKLPPA